MQFLARLQYLPQFTIEWIRIRMAGRPVFVFQDFMEHRTRILFQPPLGLFHIMKRIRGLLKSPIVRIEEDNVQRLQNWFEDTVLINFTVILTSFLRSLISVAPS
ncbi:hypothetical protein TNCV_1478291 [Trichonephila clavipes]|nr:hypothetical protein TNCV_1478291 [Trichonephila clavipes]